MTYFFFFSQTKKKKKNKNKRFSHDLPTRLCQLDRKRSRETSAGQTSAKDDRRANGDVDRIRNKTFQKIFQMIQNGISFVAHPCRSLQEVRTQCALPCRKTCSQIACLQFEKESSFDPIVSSFETSSFSFPFFTFGSATLKVVSTDLR
jgi:hypothetical protein